MKMRLSLLLLSALPTAWARASRAYAIPQALALRAADTSDDCNLPDDYHILDFAAQSQDAGKTLSAFNFTFTDDTTIITTDCYFNSTSTPNPSQGKPVPRYPCNDRRIEFIWEDDTQKLWMIQQVCAGSDGVADYEVSGSALIFLKCPDTPGTCITNSTDYRALFTSLAPVRVLPPTK